MSKACSTMLRKVKIVDFLHFAGANYLKRCVFELTVLDVGVYVLHDRKNAWYEDVKHPAAISILRQ